MFKTICSSILTTCLLGLSHVQSAEFAGLESVSMEAVEFHSLPAAAGHAGPDVPEPMVFDLVRALGVRKGELEINVLGLVPLTRRRTGSTRAPDELGLVPLSEDRGQIEWAPEIEWAPWDNFAIEFEMPFEGPKLEALKFAAQWTWGTAWDGRYIHGFQGIAERALSSTTTSWTGLYVAGMRFSSRWSLLGMWGVDHETGAGIGEKGGDRTQFLQNLTLFYTVSSRFHLGFESNYAVSTQRNRTALLMPQLQYDIGSFSLQLGFGVAMSESQTVPEAGLRVIWNH